MLQQFHGLPETPGAITLTRDPPGAHPKYDLILDPFTELGKRERFVGFRERLEDCHPRLVPQDGERIVG